MANLTRNEQPGRLKSRPDFLAVQRGLRLRGPLFLLEMIDRQKPDTPPRLGFTVTRKQGNAVERNRIRRRLKEAVRTMQGVPFQPGHDYVLVARRDLLKAPFQRIGKVLAARVAEGHRKLSGAAAGNGSRAAPGPNTNAPDDEPTAPGTM